MGEKLDHSWLRQGSTDGKEVKSIYDTWAATYDDTVKDWGYQAPGEAAKLLRADVPEVAHILDVGCGTGLTGEALRHAGFVGPIDGIDLSPESLKEAKKKGHYTQLTEVDLQQLPLPINDNAYDALLCAGVLTYITNDAALFREFARVVRSSGTLVITQRTDLFHERKYDALLA
ncbi:MAG: class I SAM-dependent methyltransferase, partial [Pseudomonadota bacterium]